MSKNIAVNLPTKYEREFANVAGVARDVAPFEMPPVRHGRFALMRLVAQDLSVSVEEAANDPIRHLHLFINKHRPAENVTPASLIDRTRRGPLSLAKAWGPNFDRIAGGPLVRGIGASSRYITNN